MIDREKVIKGLEHCTSFDDGRDKFGGVGKCGGCPYYGHDCIDRMKKDALALLKEQEKKEIKLHKKHIITWKRDDEFTMRKLYEAVCEILLDEGELFIARTDDHEKVDFVFYVADGR